MLFSKPYAKPMRSRERDYVSLFPEIFTPALKGNFPEHHPKKSSENQRYLRDIRNVISNIEFRVSNYELRTEHFLIYINTPQTYPLNL